MKERIRNKPVKKYDRYRPAEDYNVGDVLYFEAIRDWDSGGKIIMDGVYGEIIDIKQKMDKNIWKWIFPITALSTKSFIPLPRGNS